MRDRMRLRPIDSVGISGAGGAFTSTTAVVAVAEGTQCHLWSRHARRWQVSPQKATLLHRSQSMEAGFAQTEHGRDAGLGDDDSLMEKMEERGFGGAKF